MPFDAFRLGPSVARPALAATAFLLGVFAAARADAQVHCMPRPWQDGSLVTQCSSDPMMCEVFRVPGDACMGLMTSPACTHPREAHCFVEAPRDAEAHFECFAAADACERSRAHARDVDGAGVSVCRRTRGEPPWRLLATTEAPSGPAPASASRTPDETGCASSSSPPPSVRDVVPFGRNQATLPANPPLLIALVDFLVIHTSVVRLEIVGYRASGEREGIDRARADAVHAWLLAAGVPADRMVTTAAGIPTDADAARRGRVGFRLVVEPHCPPTRD